MIVPGKMLLALSLALWAMPSAAMRSSAYLGFREVSFRRQVDAALSNVKAVLENTRLPLHAADVDHTYDDKFGLAEFLGNTAIAAQANALDFLGLDDTKLKKLKDMAEKDRRSITLRMESKETCDFIEEKIVEVDGKYEVHETTRTKEKRTKVVTKITEYHWKFGVEYTIFAYAGSDPDSDDSKIVVKNRSGSKKVVVTGNKEAPRPSTDSPEPADVDLTWFLRQLDFGDSDDSISGFSIDRSSVSCHTPRRNDDVNEAEKFFVAFGKWSARVGEYFTRNLPSSRHGGTHHSAEPKSCVEIDSVNVEGLFIPVLPLFENPQQDGASPLLSLGDINSFLAEQRRSLDKKILEITETFPDEMGTEIPSSAEATVTLLAMHVATISRQFLDSMDYIEEMLRSQLVRAIGKEVQPSEFEQFLRHYYRKLFKEEYVPQPFSYAIRRPHHYPDGSLSIEGSEVSEAAEPIRTITRKLESSTPMHFPINAATSIEFRGERYLHAWVLHDFEGSLRTEQAAGVNLVARARQFSSFLLMVGTISGPNSFQPQHAIILQNKDEALLPLLLEQLPTPKEFKDAIESLSPEQKSFATAFRNMQLESSVFGVCVIQLKPQLESLLGLPYDSLTKEIRLTQDLLSLFIEYQIPSDLLTYDGNENASVEDKVSRVKNHVGAVQEMIADAKQKEVEEARKKREMRKGLREEEEEEEWERDEGVDISEARMARRLRSSRMEFHADGGESLRYMMYAAPEPMMSKGSSHLRAEAVSDIVADDPPEPTPQQPKSFVEDATTKAEDGSTIDLTMIPKQLDSKFEALDEDSALRPTKIKAGEVWTKTHQKSLLTTPETTSLGTEEQKTEKNKAFDLLDALSKSGALPIAYAELHVIVAATHRFDKSLVDTVIQDNVNPIQKLERSLLIVSSTINGLPVTSLVNESKMAEVAKHTPSLLSEMDSSVLEGVADSEARDD